MATGLRREKPYRLAMGAIVCVLGLVIFWSGLSCPTHQSALAQLPQGIFEGALLTQMQQTSTALKELAKSTGKFPSSTEELDDALNKIYESAYGSPPSGTLRITSYESYRVLGNYRIVCDESIMNTPLAQLKEHPPERWSAPANTVVIVSDGKSKCLIWAAAISGGPIRGSDGLPVYVISEIKAPKTDDQ